LDLSKEELLEPGFRKTFLVFYIINTYAVFFEQNKKQHDSIKLRFSYIAFLIEVFDVPSKALTEVMYMKVININATFKE
jgi:hypothetical protein